MQSASKEVIKELRESVSLNAWTFHDWKSLNRGHAIYWGASEEKTSRRVARQIAVRLRFAGAEVVLGDTTTEPDVLVKLDDVLLGVSVTFVADDESDAVSRNLQRARDVSRVSRLFEHLVLFVSDSLTRIKRLDDSIAGDNSPEDDVSSAVGYFDGYKIHVVSNRAKHELLRSALNPD
jgi:hypothetical protein